MVARAASGYYDEMADVQARRRRQAAIAKDTATARRIRGLFRVNYDVARHIRSPRATPRARGDRSTLSGRRQRTLTDMWRSVRVAHSDSPGSSDSSGPDCDSVGDDGSDSSDNDNNDGKYNSPTDVRVTRGDGPDSGARDCSGGGDSGGSGGDNGGDNSDSDYSPTGVRVTQHGNPHLVMAASSSDSDDCDIYSAGTSDGNCVPHASGSSSGSAGDRPKHEFDEGESDEEAERVVPDEWDSTQEEHEESIREQRIAASEEDLKTLPSLDEIVKLTELQDKKIEKVMEVVDEPGKGFGLRWTRDVPKDTLIGVYYGSGSFGKPDTGSGNKLMQCGWGENIVVDAAWHTTEVVQAATAGKGIGHMLSLVNSPSENETANVAMSTEAETPGTFPAIFTAVDVTIGDMVLMDYGKDADSINAQDPTWALHAGTSKATAIDVDRC